MTTQYTEITPVVPVEKRIPQSDFDQIMNFTVPEFESPYPSLKNKYTEKAVEECFKWFRENGLETMYKSPEVLQCAIKADIAVLPMHIYTAATEEQAPWLCQYYLWNFAVDDFLDHSDNFISPETTASLLLELNLIIMWSFPDDARLRNNLVAILKNSESADLDATLKVIDDRLALARLHPNTIYSTELHALEPLLKGFLLLWKRMAEASPPEFLLRWSVAFQLYVIANMQEVKTRSKNDIPPLGDYLVMRRNSSGVYKCAMLAELGHQAFVPDAVFYGKEFQDMHLAISDFVGWMNDIWSFKKEALLGDVHNLVYIIRYERGCSYQEAGEIAFEMLLGKIREMEQCFKILRKLTPKEDLGAVEQYIKFAENFAAAGYDWHANSTRYKVKNSASAQI